MVILLAMTKYFYVTFFKKQNILVTSVANSCFLDIFIWFERVHWAPQEYEQQKNSDPIFSIKLGGN